MGIRRWFVKLISSVCNGVSPALLSCHRMVMRVFPDTPWVYGGGWSWFTNRFRWCGNVVVYPYLPLVLIDKDGVPPDVMEDLIASCTLYGVPLVDANHPTELETVLNRLMEAVSGA